MPAKKPKAVRDSVSLYDAKTHLSSLVDRASAGEEIVIMKSGRAKAPLVPMDGPRALRVPGRGKGAWRVAADFDAPLPDETLDGFGMGGGHQAVHRQDLGQAISRLGDRRIWIC